MLWAPGWGKGAGGSFWPEAEWKMSVEVMPHFPFGAGNSVRR